MAIDRSNGSRKEKQSESAIEKGREREEREKEKKETQVFIEFVDNIRYADLISEWI